MRLVSTIIILLAVSIRSSIAQVKYEADTIKSSKEYQSEFSKNRISISSGFGFSYKTS